MEARRSSENLGRHLLIAFLLALAFYIVGFWASEYWRHRRGPWAVTFGTNQLGEPCLEVNQSRLGIAGVRLVFAGASSPGAMALPVTVRFADPSARQAVPFGEVKFLDTTELPGTVTLELAGHEIELLPRVLIIDRKEHAWQARETHSLAARP